MNRTVPILLLALGLLGLGAATAQAAPDVFLQWDDCPPAGQPVRTFACNTNAGVEVLIGAFTTDQTVASVNGILSTLLVKFPQSSIPSWWDFGGCRASNSLQIVTSFAAGPFSCTDPWPASSAGGVVWDVIDASTGWARIRAVQAVPSGDEFTLQAGVMYYAFKIVYTHAKSTGTGACGGCEVPAGLLLQQVRISRSNDVNDVVIGVPFDTRNDPSHFADWQCDGSPLWEWDRNSLVDYTYGSNCAVPARATTWGSVKLLYR